jgi:hypothetical protein
LTARSESADRKKKDVASHAPLQLWRFVVSDLQVDPDRSDAGFRLRLHYGKYLLDFETACVAAEQAVSAGATDPSTVQLARFVAMTPEEHQQRVAASVASARASCSALLAETTSTTTMPSMPSSSSDALAQSSSAAAAATPVLAPQGLMLHEVAYMSIKAASNPSVRRASADVLPAKAPVQAGTRKRATASAADSCDGDDDVFVTARPSKQMPDYVTVQKNLNNLAVGRVRPTEIVNVAAAPPTTRGSDDDSTEELATIAKFLTRLRDDFL